MSEVRRDSRCASACITKSYQADPTISLEDKLHCLAFFPKRLQIKYKGLIYNMICIVKYSDRLNKGFTANVHVVDEVCNTILASRRKNIRRLTRLMREMFY